MYRKTLTAILLVIVSCTSLAWATEPNDYLIPGREKLFDGTLSGVRQAYQLFTNGINDPNCSDNSELKFFHAAAGTAMLAIRDDGVSINSFFELASEFGIDVLGDNWHQLATYHPVNEHDAYEIPAGAPDENEIRSIFDTSMVPDVNSLIAELESISDSPPFRIFLDPNETRIFDPNSPALLFDVEVDYAEVLLLKGLLMALKGQLQAQSAYDMYVDPNDNLVEKLHNNSFNMNTDLLGPYPHLLKVAPTTNNPDNGATILAQARQDLIGAIDYYFVAINYIRDEGDAQEDDFLYIDPNDEYGLVVVDDRLTTLRDSLANDTVGTYPWETARTYTIKNIGGTPIGELVVVYDITGLDGDKGSLTFTDGTPTPWEVDWVGREDPNLVVDVEYYENGQWRQGFLEGTLSQGDSSITNATFQYWGQVTGTLSNLSGNLIGTEIVDAKVDLNPLYGSSARYPNPVNHRDLLPEFDEWNGPLPGTMGHGLNDDPTLGGILPDMNQYDWQVELDLQPAGLPVISYGTAIINGSIGEWNPAQIVLNDISGDTEEDPNPIPGMDIDKLYMSYDTLNLYGAITLYDNISSSINYTYELLLSYSPDDESALGTIRLKIDVSNGSATSSLWHKDNPNGYPEWISISGSEASAGLSAVEFKIPRANIPGGLAGRYILLESWGWNPNTFEWHDGEWNETHLKVGGLGTNELGTISGTITYNDYSGAPIFVQAYIDPWDPEGSIIASTMITAPGAYTLTGIGIGWQGYVRASTPLFGFNIFDTDALTIEASTPVTLSGSVLSGVNLALGEPTTLPDGTWVQGQIYPNTYDEDWYAFEAQQGRVYALDLARGTTQYATMTLYDRDGDTELEERYSGRWQHIDWTCLDTGTYYIGVSNGYQSDSGTYQLRITRQNSMPSGYEVWGGDIDYTSQPNSWEYYYNIDKQGYVKLGESRDGGSGIFDGDYYAYYVIASHEPVTIDSVGGSNGQFYSGYPSTGNTLNPNDIRLAPDNLYATVGNSYSGGTNGTFEGFVVINNPGWNSLSVITSASDTGSISGQVVDPNGSELAGVDVEIYIGDDENIADEDAWNYYGSTTTDPNGEYSFALLPQRRYRVRIPDWEVSGTHYFEANLYNVQVLAGPVTPNMNLSLREAGLIYGYVRTSGGVAIQNAEVIAEAAWTQKGHGWHWAQTDENGRYEFWVAPSPGKFYPIWVRNASLGGVSYEWNWDGNLYRATLADTHGPDYSLGLGGTATGRVVNETGVGIEDVWVTSQWSSEAGISEIDIGPWAETEPNGYFTLRGLKPGTNYVCLENDWREIQRDGVKYMVGEVYAGPINVSAGETVDFGTFTIYEAGMVTGIVTDESGFPIVGVEMELEGQDIDGNWASREDEVTDAFGQYTLDYVAPGTYVLWCYKDGFITTIETDIRVDKGEHVYLDDVVLKSAAEGAAISGRITNYEAVAAYDSDNSVYYPYYEDSDYDEFGLSCWFELLVVGMDRTFTEEDYLNPDGKFIIDWIEEEQIDDGYGDYFEVDANETRGNYATTLPAGDIAIGMLVGEEFLPGWGGYIILHDWKRLNLTKGDSVSNLNFTAVTTDTGTLKGDIIVPTGYDDHLPESWCLIYAYALDPNGNMETALPGAIAFTGWTTAYEFRNLPAGDYMLKAYARNLASVIVPSVTVNVDGTTIQDIEFTFGGTLTGQVTNGTPVSGATVTIEENGKQTSTDASGDYTITGINTGTYTVNASALGYADAQASVQVTEGSVTTRDFALSATVGSISGTVKEDIADANVNGATVVAYNETDDTSKTAETVGGAFSIAGLTPGQYLLAVNTDNHGVVVYPTDGSRITLSATKDITGINITVGTLQPPVFTVTSSASDTDPVVLSMEFYSDPNLAAVPTVSIIVDGNGVLDPVIPISNSALNRFNIDYTADASDNLVRIQIAETTPLVSGSPASKTFTFEVGSNLVSTSSTNVTNATGGSTSIMGTQDNTEIYVPPFAIAGAEDDAQALSLTIERYGDPGDAVEGTDANSVSAVYDFSFDEEGVSIDENHTFTITMSFQLPAGMTQQEFEDSLVISYFDAGDQRWKTDGISNVRINWANSTIIFEVSHLSPFVAFLQDLHAADKDNNYMIGDFELLDYIDLWAIGQVEDFPLLDTIDLWAAGNYYWDSSDQKFKPGTP